jgi:hypothetical protein
VQPALNLGDVLGHVDGAGVRVDAGARQPGQLPDAQPAVGDDEHQRPVGPADHLGQAGDLGRVEIAHLLRLDPGQGDSSAG